MSHPLLRASVYVGTETRSAMVVPQSALPIHPLASPE